MKGKKQKNSYLATIINKSSDDKNFKKKYILYHMKTALLYSQLSSANRLKCGAILVTPDNTRILMIGYNGTPSGSDNCCEIIKDNNLITRPEVVHAEANVILYCAKHGIATNNCNLYITHSPCLECSKLIITSGIKRVFFNEKYRLEDGIDLLKKFDLDVIQIQF